ncbi:DUF5317 domain-containing protein [Coriobacteriia bacterium Es71-Z0120]|uniref:DUF5317 family protein n=1 Tax=Parvivirga hydrogeniphila TaxID=2939460 RepID=UPI002260F499|nr:DUF5317 family protein [Parvivirga hydrogeniphila]MCL4078809.1 DUF5317 domain-containing protein [Parvivirga hydrogeniphila]
MILFLVAVIVGIAVGLARGGSLARLEQVRLRGEAGLVFLLVLQMALPAVTTRLGVPAMLALGAWLLAMAGLVVLALVNTREPGMVLVALGVALNLMVIGLNAGMPVSERALNIVARSDTVEVSDLVHRTMDDETLLPWLTDVIPVPGPRGLRGVVSIGDLLLVAGAGWFLADAVRRGGDEVKAAGSGSHH